jgi:hypothetical protein
MKKTIFLFAILIAAATLNSCWIAPVYQDYESVGKACYFKDYDTMKAVTISKINKSFTEWHWSTKEFDSKLDKYMNNYSSNSPRTNFAKVFRYLVTYEQAHEPSTVPGPVQLVVTSALWQCPSQ